MEERESEKTLEVVKTQVQGFSKFSTFEVDNLVLAYEPVWAIGTGKTATDEMAQEVHAYVRGLLVDLFGDAAGSYPYSLRGSMKPENAAGLLSQPDVDGGLMRSASLNAKSFCAIVDSALNA